MVLCHFLFDQSEMTKTSRTRTAAKQADEQDYKDNLDQDQEHDLEADEQVDLYKEMGVNAAATTVEIKSAYRKLALKYHPGNYSLLQLYDCSLVACSHLLKHHDSN